MKIAKLEAQNVHGYLPINIVFFEDLTFLTGLNGSGKTSALRLLMALLTPNFEELVSVSLSNAQVTVQDTDKSFVIKASKTPDMVDLSISSLDHKLEINIVDIELYMDIHRRDETRSTIIEKYQQHPVSQAIREISTPMFLGLDRRFFPPNLTNEDAIDARRREFMARRYLSDDSRKRESSFAALSEINYLVMSKMQEVRASQEQLDERLRSQFFTKAFEYKPSDPTEFGAKLPSRDEIDRYRQQLQNIERAAEGVRIPVPEIQSALTLFFEKMSQVVEALEKKAQHKSSSRKGAKGISSNENQLPDKINKDYIEWIINRPQADKILEHLRLLEDYIVNRNALRDPIERFLSLVNNFFHQTNKEVYVTKKGQLKVKVIGMSDELQITDLSSGERQLLVMLAHLSLNPNLTNSGVFIVDEPELSLHIDWQEKFVDAVCKANPNVQLILATHSPAIILDRDYACWVLSGVSNA